MPARRKTQPRPSACAVTDFGVNDRRILNGHAMAVPK
jgi:hypothetical protein